MNAEPSTSPHRTDAKRGSRVRVATGVYERAGRFSVQFVDPSGVVRFKTLPPGTNKTQAIAAREKTRVDVREGRAVVPSKLTLSLVAEDFLSTFESLVQSGEKSERTLELYRQRWRSHLEPKLGRFPVQQIRPEHVARALEDYRRAGLAPWTVQGIYVILGSIVTHAMTRGLLMESPLKRLAKTERPRGKAQTQARTLTDEECGKLISAAPGLWAVMIALAASTGLRLSELLGLTWGDLNLTDAQIHVRQQLSVAKGDKQGTREAKPARLVSLKTGAGERDVYLLPELVTLLKRHKAERFAIGRAGAVDFVFGTKNGKPLTQRNTTRALRRAGDAVGLNPEGAQPASWHDLRHTAISRMIAAGLDVVEVQRQAGHSKPSITLDIYSHQFQQAKRSDDIRAKLEAMGLGAVVSGST